MSEKVCAVLSCDGRVWAKSLCRKHYMRVRYHGHTGLLPQYDRRGSKNPKWKGGKTVDGQGRVYLRAPNHPCANAWGYVYRYRLRMERKLGRILGPDEVIHHKDGDCSNDRLRNLELLTNSTHSKLHNSLKPRNKNGQFMKQI